MEPQMVESIFLGRNTKPAFGGLRLEVTDCDFKTATSCQLRILRHPRNLKGCADGILRSFY